MWHHTRDDHGGEVGEVRGLSDYRFVPLRTHRDNLSRQTSEGYRQTLMEHLQSQGKVKCLNSKLDFVQPLMSNINVSKGNRNFRPGQVSSIDTMHNSNASQESVQQLSQAQTDTSSQTDSQQTELSRQATQELRTDLINIYTQATQENHILNSESMTNYSFSQTLKKEMKITFHRREKTNKF